MRVRGGFGRGAEGAVQVAVGVEEGEGRGGGGWHSCAGGFVCWFEWDGLSCARGALCAQGSDGGFGGERLVARGL